MKKALSKINIQYFMLILCMGFSMVVAQTSYHYPLQANFNEASGAAPALTTWPNALGQTGSFVTRTLPATTCQGIGQFSGYEYANNAGLRFGLPANFISCNYSIQFTWSYDNPGGLEEWIRLLSFVYTDDAGLDLWTQPPSTQAALYYWYLNPVLQFPGFCLAQPTLGALSPGNYFNDTDYYQLTITRNCSGLLTMYANGAVIGSFTDVHQRYLPHNNQIVFFRDTADTSCYPTAFPNAASSGFIKDLVIADYVFTAAEIATDFQDFCPVFLPLSWQHLEAKSTTQGNVLSWAVNSPDWIDHFEVMRSSNGQDFQSIAEVSLPNEKASSFVYQDRNPLHAKSYYRIQAVDLAGEIHMSGIREVMASPSFRIYPNPARGHIFISVPEANEIQEVEMLDLHGKKLRTSSLRPGNNKVSLNGLPAGFLILRIGHEQRQILNKLP